MRDKLRKLLIVGAFVLGAVPLLVYPAVLLAGVMSLAAIGDPHIRGDAPLLLVVVSAAFFIGTIAYPAVYSPCLYAVWNAKAENRNWSVRLSLLPLLYLGIICLLVLGAMNLGSQYDLQRASQPPKPATVHRAPRLGPRIDRKTIAAIRVLAIVVPVLYVLSTGPVARWTCQGAIRLRIARCYCYPLAMVAKLHPAAKYAAKWYLQHWMPVANDSHPIQGHSVILAILDADVIHSGESFAKPAG